MLTAPALAALPGIRHVFSTREGGVSSGLYASLNCGLGSQDARENVLENRARVAAAVGLAPEALVNLHQIHSPDCVAVDTPWPPQEAPRADALATRTPGIAQAVASADCTPVLLADPAAGVIGAAHAGWRGAASGVLEAALERMEALGADRAAIVAAIGPTISAAHYEVGADFVEAVTEQDPGARAFLSPGAHPDKAQFDLPGYVGHRLARAGIGHVEDLALCTYADEARHFSYRRATHRGEPDYGRHYAAIALAHG